MFTPKYDLTPNLLTSLTTVERLYGQLESLRLPQKLLLNLERDNLVQSAYVSNSIEGNPLSQPEVTNLLLDDRIPVNRDEQEVRNYYDILRTIQDHAKERLSIDVMLKLHQQLLNKVNDEIAGQIRDTRVIVGNYQANEEDVVGIKIKHEPPTHNREEISQYLTELFSWIEEAKDIPPILKVGIFHHQFVYIHPFVDGNGRVCRLLTALLLLKHGYQINKYFVLDDYYDLDRMQYSDKLNTADMGNKTEWLEYFSEGVQYSLQSALAKAQASASQLPKAQRLSSREQELLELFQQQPELTSAEIADSFGVSRQQAHNLVNGLLEQGFVEKFGNTKSAYYKLK